MKKLGWLVALWSVLMGAFGGTFASILVTDLRLILGYALALFGIPLLGAWLWVPFVSRSRAERIATKFMRKKSREKWIYIYITSTELKGQRWDVCGYWIDPADLNRRHHFWVKVHSKCGNVTAC